MKRSLLLLIVLAILPVAFADVVREQISVRTKFYSSDYDTLDATFYGPDGSDNWSHSGYTSLSPVRYQQIVPGKEYFVVVSGIDPTDTYDVYFSAPAGYEILVAGPSSSDYQNRRHILGTQMGYSAHTYRVFIKRADTDSNSRPFGESSGWPPDRLTWELSLGQLQSGFSAGAVEIRADNLSSLFFTPSDLIYTAATPEVTVVKSGSSLRQVLVPAGMFDIQTITSGTSYKISVYDSSAVGSWNGSTYNTTGSPIYVYTVSKNTASRIEVKKGVGSTQSPFWTTWLEETSGSTTVYDWVKASTDPAQATLRKTITTKTVLSLTETCITEEYGRAAAGGAWPATPSSRTLRKYQSYGSGSSAWGPVLIEETKGYSGTSPATTTYQYYTSVSDGGGFRKLKQVVRPDGGQSLYEYEGGDHTYGLIKKQYEPFGNTNPAFGTTAGEVTTYLYSSVSYGGKRRPTVIETKIGNLPVAKVEHAYSVPASGILKTVTKVYHKSDAFLTSTSWSYLDSVSDHSLRGKLYGTLYPDGIKERYTYTVSAQISSPASTTATRPPPAGKPPPPSWPQPGRPAATISTWSRSSQPSTSEIPIATADSLARAATSAPRAVLPSSWQARATSTSLVRNSPASRKAATRSIARPTWMGFSNRKRTRAGLLPSTPTTARAASWRSCKRARPPPLSATSLPPSPIARV